MNNRQQQTLIFEKTKVEVNSLRIEGGAAEHHVMIHVTDAKLSFTEQLAAVFQAYDAVLSHQLRGAQSVFKRYYLSDVANQANVLLGMNTEGSECAVSIVQQAPLSGTKVALWCYLIEGAVGSMLSDGIYEVRHGAYRDLWSVGNLNKAANSEYQTRLLLSDYVVKLNEQGLKLADHCVRTWFFVQDIDRNYAGVVKARNEVFLTQNLTSETHFIASTGIGGGNAQVEALVLMDAYAVAGLQPGQMKYLYARTHLNPTYEYGVSFERGTYVDYGDRRKVYISGTASINNKGEILYEGDIRQQTARMLENVEMLLKEAECTFADVDQMTVYLRDPADYQVVKEIYERHFPDTPKVLVNAFVCRPGWLIEMECMATRQTVNQAYPKF